MKKLTSIILLLIILCSIGLNVFAHSGALRDDGGHFQEIVVGDISHVDNYHYH